MNKARLIDGPLHGRIVDVPEPLPMDLMIDGYKYIFWFSNWHATDGKVSGSVGYAFSGTDK